MNCSDTKASGFTLLFTINHGVGSDPACPDSADYGQVRDQKCLFAANRPARRGGNQGTYLLKELLEVANFL